MSYGCKRNHHVLLHRQQPLPKTQTTTSKTTTTKTTAATANTTTAATANTTTAADTTINFSTTTKTKTKTTTPITTYMSIRYFSGLVCLSRIFFFILSSTWFGKFLDVSHN